MRVTKSKPEVCVGCGRTIAAWRFKLGDTKGWWHPICMVKDTKRRG